LAAFNAIMPTEKDRFFQKMVPRDAGTVKVWKMKKILKKS
jgi:hypothetical protein